MQLVHSISQMSSIAVDARKLGKKIGLVPTMGALHEGHLTLVNQARSACDFVVVSVFVNPTQFLPNEDFEKYPRTLEDDAAACEKAGVDVVFAPSAAEMYPQGYDSWVEVGTVTETLEGAIRPGHFRGVTTVCTKLINIVAPDIAFFGRKDYQQLAVMKKLVQDLNMPVKIKPVGIVRESDGMAMSSRNRYLSTEERAIAVTISKSLFTAGEAYFKGEHRTSELIKIARDVLSSQPDIELDYLVIADADTLEPVTDIYHPSVMLIAARLGKVRLIDNILIGEIE